MDRRSLLEYLIAAILKASQTSYPVTVIGIDGKGCSGKSTISNSIFKALKTINLSCELVSIDDFCNPRNIRYSPDVIEPLQVYQHNFDETLFDTILTNAHGAGSLEIEVMTLNVKTDKLSTPISIHLPHGGILLVEGIHLFKNHRKHLFDLKILITIDEKVQLDRALIRDPERGVRTEDIVRKYQTRFIPSYQYYLNVDNPLSTADIIVNNDDLSNPLIIKQFSP